MPSKKMVPPNEAAAATADKSAKQKKAKDNRGNRLQNPAEYERYMLRAEKVREASEDFGVSFIRQAEWTRLRKRFTQAEMAKLLGLQVTTYMRTLRRIAASETKHAMLWLDAFARYCYLFGFDVATDTEFTQKEKNINDDCICLAMTIGGLDRHSLIAIKDEIYASDMTPSNKKEVGDIIDRLLRDKAEGAKGVVSDDNLPPVLAKPNQTADAAQIDAEIAAKRSDKV